MIELACIRRVLMRQVGPGHLRVLFVIAVDRILTVVLDHDRLLLLLLTADWDPFVDSHRRVADCDPFFLPMKLNKLSERIK